MNNHKSDNNLSYTEHIPSAHWAQLVDRTV